MSTNFKATKEMIALLILALSVGEDALKDGKIDFNDIGGILKLIPALQPAIQDASQIPGEFSQIDAASGAELLTYVMTSLTIGDEHAKKVINESLKTLLQISNLISAIKSA